MGPHERQFNLPLPGKTPPHQSHSETSRAAAEGILPTVGTGRRRVYDFLKHRGIAGATDQEIQIGLGMSGDTVRPRRGELVGARLVVRRNLTRKTRSGFDADVWVIAHPTQETLM